MNKFFISVISIIVLITTVLLFLLFDSIMGEKNSYESAVINKKQSIIIQNHIINGKVHPQPYIIYNIECLEGNINVNGNFYNKVKINDKVKIKYTIGKWTKAKYQHKIIKIIK